MFRLKIEVDIPTDEHEEARLVQEHLIASVERGLGFQCHTALWNMGVDPGRRVGFSYNNEDHSHSFAIDHAVLQDENGNWFHPAHVVNHTPQFTEEEKKKLLKQLNVLPEPDFLEEEEMKL